jgi:opacity protein-like surface antigen
MKTKLYLLVAAGMLISVATFGQTKFGVHAGINISNERAKAGSVSLSLNSKVGLQVGGFAEINISDGLAIQPELNFSQMGAELGGIKENLNFLSVPVLAKIKLGGFGIYAGPQLGLLLSAKDKDNTGSVNVKDSFKSTDFAAIAGAEYAFAEKIVASARYQMGLANTAQDAGSGTLKNTAVTITLGYKF